MVMRLPCRLLEHTHLEPEAAMLGGNLALERPCVCALVGSPVHCVFPIGHLGFVEHQQAISLLFLLCPFQIPNPPYLCK